MLKFALVGCGRIATRHAELLGLGHIEGASLAAVCDVEEARARTLAERMGVPGYFDMQTMMREGDVDVVVVLTESGLHAEHVVELGRTESTSSSKSPWH